jgi:hypothetical protein
VVWVEKTSSCSEVSFKEEDRCTIEYLRSSEGDDVVITSSGATLSIGEPFASSSDVLDRCVARP